MDTQELHRGRLIDHVQLIVRDLPAARTFYAAVFDALAIAAAEAAPPFIAPRRSARPRLKRFVETCIRSCDALPSKYQMNLGSGDE